jgi:predicted DsbA family dithiol-disulfide isomerase
LVSPFIKPHYFDRLNLLFFTAQIRIRKNPMLVTIDIYSDPICPWCFVGKRRLERALAARPEIKSELRWRAFQLNPAMPEGGMERGRYFVTKFGSLDEARRLYEHIAAVGAREGIDFKFDKIENTPNTVAAHTLIRFAAENGCGDAVAEALFRAFFFEGRDIGSDKELRDIAYENDLDPDRYEAYRGMPNTITKVQSEDLLARRIGIDGVPYFIIEGRYALSGAQEPEAFYNIFDMVLETFRNQSTAKNAALGGS